MIAGADRLRAALQRVANELGAPDAEVTLERPKDPGHGDLASNLAMKLAGRLKQKPRALAEQIVAQLGLPNEVVTRVEIAGPGFINFWLAEGALARILLRVLSEGPQFGEGRAARTRKVNVEFVSANPTGPLHVGHGRGAALGDSIARLLETQGHEVTREFYVNDAGVQIDKLARSLWARVQQAVGRKAEIPEGGYHGEYLVPVAQELLKGRGPKFADEPLEEALRWCREWALKNQLAEQLTDLMDFGVRFDVWKSESELYQSQAIESALEELKGRGVVYEKDGALWLKTSEFGDDKDRVLRKSDGSYTYFAPDIAYHLDKARRGFAWAIDVWGADHHGYVARMAAAFKALGLPDDFFHVELVQLVRVERHGKEVKFSKRSGEFVTLRDLYEETGVDAARYFFLMRKGDSHFVFDIDLATKQSEENPVYYVQYAHTRMAGIFRTAGTAGAAVTGDGVDLGVLRESDEQEVLKHLADFPAMVSRAAENLEPHRIVAYLDDLARLANGWYHRHRVIGAPEPVEQARLVLARAIQIVLANGLTLLGVSAPERM
ncbi:MAG: arginine--tRNA ligase [Gemmatimonadetes bacterium]|nr:arginine--tRNA ligase [Gemmatimonadota bacterium]